MLPAVLIAIETLVGLLACALVVGVAVGLVVASAVEWLGSRKQPTVVVLTRQPRQERPQQEPQRQH